MDVLICACLAKLHRATVTEADLNYMGSIILAEAGLEPSQIKNLNPVIVCVDDKNKVMEVKHHQSA
jgi:aspartate 1-decarboxylase